MPRRLGNSDPDFLASNAVLRSHLRSNEPLPPYELDPIFDDPQIRRRIGELIAQAADAYLRRGR
ncbi:MAG: hypothetical protein M3R18_02745 [Pseudomonadota bacterium]|nr:hypothetical protein [Pseudomonadota bacterium]